MKTFISLIAVCFSLTVNAQQREIKTNSRQEPIFFLDSVKINLQQLHFDLNKIANINVVNNYYDSAKHVHGKIFIISKQPKDFNFLSIADIIQAYKENMKSPTVFMLDNELLKDTTDFKIDFSYILKVEILRGSEIEYLKNVTPDLMIVRILTRTKENLNKQNKIRIRGEETVLHK